MDIQQSVPTAAVCAQMEWTGLSKKLHRTQEWNWISYLSFVDAFVSLRMWSSSMPGCQYSSLETVENSYSLGGSLLYSVPISPFCEHNLLLCFALTAFKTTKKIFSVISTELIISFCMGCWLPCSVVFQVLVVSLSSLTTDLSKEFFFFFTKAVSLGRSESSEKWKSGLFLSTKTYLVLPKKKNPIFKSFIKVKINGKLPQVFGSTIFMSVPMVYGTVWILL